MTHDRSRHAAWSGALVASTLVFTASLCHAQAWPDKPMRLVVPFPPGGSTDVVGRLLADKLSLALSQAVVVDNKAGAGGTIGADFVAKAAADGYTMLLGTSSTQSIAPSLYSRLPYDPAHDFAPVTLIGTATILLVVNPAVPAKSVRELIALGKSKPGELTYASSGNGSISHLTGAYFASLAGIEAQHIPYKGDAPMLNDLLGGRVSMAFGTAVAFLPQVKDGKLVALAVTDAAPSPVVPGVPTVASSGLPGFEALQWFGILLPAGTPKDIVARLNAETVRVLQKPDVRERLQALGIVVIAGPPERFAGFVRAETAKWARVVQSSGAKVD